MTRARYTQVFLDSTSCCHCICCCIRRTFQCGKDHYSGQDYVASGSQVGETHTFLDSAVCTFYFMSKSVHVSCSLLLLRPVDMAKWKLKFDERD